MKKKGKSPVKIVLIVVLLLAILCPSSAIFTSAQQQEEFVLSKNYALKKVTSVNNAYSKGPKEAAVDGDITTFWRTNSSWTEDFIYCEVNLGKAVEINTAYLALYNPERIDTVKLQYTSDENPNEDTTWTDIKVLSNTELKAITIVSFETVNATGFRFYSDLSQKSAGLYELQLYYTNNAKMAKEKLLWPDYKTFTQPEAIAAKIVSVASDGSLVYADYDGNGATMIDYSYVGYKNGDEEIPNVPVVKTLEPGTLEDHTSLIQNAIDEMASKPVSERGAILLKAGRYTISSTLNISKSGIVLRGEGQGENGTVIYDVRKEKEVTSLTVAGTGNYSVVSGTKNQLIDDYVPVGETKMKLSSVDAYKVGDQIKVVCTPNELWVKTLGMDLLTGVTLWVPSEYVMTYERWITEINVADSTVTINTGIPITLDQKYYATEVETIVDSEGRITECGVENLRFLSYYNGAVTDEDHAWNAVVLSNCRNCWVQDVTAKHYADSTVNVGAKAINVTVEGCSYIDPISQVSGGRRSSFAIGGGQYTLVKNCYSNNARHDYAISSKVCGPNVFVDCVAENSNSVSEPHHRWSNGTLYDNVFQIGTIRLGYFQAVNRGTSGTGHGWAGATTVFWNCLSPAIVVSKPQTEQNFAIGVYGIYQNPNKSDYLTMYNNGYNGTSVSSVVTKDYPYTMDFADSPMYGNGYIESVYNPVSPFSLYRAQLAYRLNGNAYQKVTPNAPILEYPKADSVSESYTVVFKGSCDQNAVKVYIWVDGKRYEAQIHEDGSNTYSAALYLPNGYHDVSVTQVAGRTESALAATRTILVDSNEEFHQANVPAPIESITDFLSTLEDIAPIISQESNSATEPTGTDETTTGETGATNDDPTGSNSKTVIIVYAASAVVGVVIALVVFVVINRRKKADA